MKNIARDCPVCAGTDFGKATAHYKRCKSCGHEILSLDYEKISIINDRLDLKNLEQLNQLDRFKASVVRRCVRSKSFLLDIGSASGRFLFQHRHYFKKVMGVEVTPECINFSRELGLRIEPNLAKLEDELAVVTCWHSLEHIPDGAQRVILESIRTHTTDETVLVVSVPNADSLQYRLLRTQFAFYDYPAHLHQFSVSSLDALLSQYGFEYSTSYISLSYAGFGWMQGLLNLFNTRHNYYYYRSKRGWDFSLSPGTRRLMDGFNLILMAGLVIPVTLLTLLDILFPQLGGVVTRCYYSKTH